MQSAIRFLRDVWRVQEGPYFCISTKSTAGKWKDHLLEWPISPDEFETFFERYPTEDYNLYFCPHGFTEPRRLKQFAAPTRFLWADLDDVDPTRCKPRPQVAWESSPDRHAALWRLNNLHKTVDIEEVNRSLTYAAGSDKAGWDVTQVLRIPGTRNHKYKGSPRGKLMWWRDNELGLDEFPDAPESQLEYKAIVSKWRDRLSKDLYRLLTTKHAPKGARSEIIWRLENALHEAGMSDDEVFTAIKGSAWNKFKGRRDEDGQLRRELDKVKDNHENNGKSNGSAPPPREGMKLVRMSDVQIEKVDWLWYPYIPRGKLTIVEGDPGLGKSWFTLALCCQLSKGEKFPGQRERDAHLGRVVMMSAEDGLGDTVRPRIEALGGDAKKIFAIDGAQAIDSVTIDDLRRIVQDVQPMALVMDPLQAYMSAQIDMHKANETRGFMTMLSEMAQEFHLSVILVRHLTKGTRDKSIYRGLGSIDLTAAARSVLLIGRNPEDPDEGRVVCHIKSNLGPVGKAQSYALRKAERPFTFEGEVNFTPDEVFKTEATGGDSQWDILVKWLEEVLKEGARWADDLRRDAEAKAFPDKMLNRARRELGLRVTTHGGKVQWAWPA